MRQVMIDAVLNGWVVKVGCQRLVYENKDKLLADLAEYMDDPDGKETRMKGEAQNKYLLDSREVECAAVGDPCEARVNRER